MQSFNDSQRSKPQFQEHFRHANNESDVSDEDMDLDVDENMVISTRNTARPPPARASPPKRESSVGPVSRLRQPGFMSQQLRSNEPRPLSASSGRQAVLP